MTWISWRWSPGATAGPPARVVLRGDRADADTGRARTSWGSVGSGHERHRVRRLVRAFPVSSFFVAAYALSWSYWLVVLGLLGHMSALAYWTGGFGPAIAGLLVSAASAGGPGVRGYLRRIVIWRVGMRWYVVALLGPPAVVLAGLLPALLAASPTPRGWQPAVEVNAWFFPLLLSNFVFLLVTGTGLGEEPGWRGFALPRLQERLGPVRGAVLLGLLWAGWHLPLVVLVGFNGGVAVFPWYAAFSVGFSVLLAWLFNHTGGSVLLVALAHVSMNESQSLTSALSAQMTAVSAFLPTVLVAAVVTVATRGRLGYRPDEVDSMTGPAEGAPRGRRPSRGRPSRRERGSTR